ncbi:hypothetical protein K438DRAFT_1477670, partial [Mycena galopus ATCC 62051]
LTIVSTQGYVSKAMTTKLAHREREGWVGVPHGKVLKCLAAEIKARQKKVTFVVAPKAPDVRLLCRDATELAKAGTRGTRTHRIGLDVPAGLGLTGIQVQGNKQKVFYRGIREAKAQELETRPSTGRKLAEVRESLKRSQGRLYSDKDIWRSIRNKDFLPRTAQFLWRAMHNAHRVGDYWRYIPECEDRATCHECGEVEDLEHILISCDSPGAKLIWKAAETLWLEKETAWPEITLGGILGCGLAQFKDDTGKPNHGARRLYRILVSESAYAIWLLRNERVIARAGSPLTEAEVINKWICRLNLRLQQDILLANRSARKNRPHLAPTLVKETWSGTLDDEVKLPTNWLKDSRVLVG